METIGKIAVILPGDGSFNSEFLQGIFENAQAYGYDILVLTNAFNSPVNKLSIEYIRGENNIFSLIAYIDLNGIIFDDSEFHDINLIKRITEMIKLHSVPCITTDDKNSKFSYVPKSDNYFHMGLNAINRLHQIITGSKTVSKPKNYFKQSAEKDQELENQITGKLSYDFYKISDYVTTLFEKGSLEDFFNYVDEEENAPESCEFIGVCLCEDWKITDGKYRTNGYSRRMFNAISNCFCQNDVNPDAIFDIGCGHPFFNALHSPCIAVLMPVHNRQQVFGYGISIYTNASDFRHFCNNHIFDYGFWCDIIAKGIYFLQEKLNFIEMQKKTEKYSMKDTLSGMYNKKGFIKQASDFFENLKDGEKTGILLIITHTDKLLSTTSHEMLTIMNTIQIACRPSELPARVSAGTFAVFLPLNGGASVNEQAERWFINFDKMIKEIFRQKGFANIPNFVTDHSTVHILQLSSLEDIIDERLNILTQKINENDKSKTDYTELLNQILREIKHEPQLDWSIPGIASRLGISESYLQRIYVKQFERTCMDDIITARINKAKSLLRETNLNINEIAEQCGYKNPGSFMKLFKRKTGMTAKEYRNSSK